MDPSRFQEPPEPGTILCQYNPLPYVPEEDDSPRIDYDYEGPIQPVMYEDTLDIPPADEWQRNLNLVGKWRDLPETFRVALGPPESARWPGDSRFPECFIWGPKHIPVAQVSNRSRDEVPVMHFAENSEDIIFGLHASCLELARLAFKRYGHQKDLRQFVQCLIYHRRKNLDEKEELRFPEEPTGKNIPPCYIEWDNGSYYGLRRKNGQEPTRPTWSWWDPLELGSLTAYVISQVRPTDVEKVPQNLKRKRREDMAAIEKLPTELLDLMISYLPGYSALSLQNSSKSMQQRVWLTQRFWRDELISGCVGSFFDLDARKILKKDAECPGDGKEWDWKGLVAKFSLIQRLFEQDDQWEDPTIPQSMRNRCRVWRIARDIQELAAGLAAEGAFDRIEPPFIEGIPALIPDLDLRDYACPRQVNPD